MVMFSSCTGAACTYSTLDCNRELVAFFGSSFASEDWVGTSRNSAGRLKAFLWLIGWVLRACPRFDSRELFHLEEALGGGRLLLDPRIDIRVGHGAGSSVFLGWVEHLLTVMLVKHADIVRFGTVLVASHLAVEVSEYGFDGRSGSQRLSVGELHVLIRRDHHWRSELLLALSTSASVSELA